MSHQVPDETKNQIADAIFAGRKIEAIKLYREATGLGLAESKEFIEELTDELREKSPEKFAPKKAGCGSAALIFLGAIAFLARTIVG